MALSKRGGIYDAASFEMGVGPPESLRREGDDVDLSGDLEGRFTIT